ncbi:MAG: UDP-N-acetylmuramoyl-L-alanyl-D-glutamate--2,6-diaminopimelate ligase, partial [Verrucomicrobiales bacterium]
VAVVAERAAPADCKIPWVRVGDSRKALGLLAARWHDDPSADFPVIGVTGTNGKTTTSFFIQHLLTARQWRCGLLGTVRVHDGRGFRPATHTTPGALELQGLLADMRDNGCHAVVMETSSHGLEQRRVAGVSYAVGVFTNLTQDHLDYHGDEETYFQAKRLLFESMAAEGSEGVAVINIDDRRGQQLAEEFAGRLKVLTFGFGEEADLRASLPRQQSSGQEFTLDYKSRSYLVRLPFIGRFNVSNALAALGSVLALGMPVREAVKALAGAPQTPGRMEFVGADRMAVYVDYAHTPDAVEKACETVRELNPRRLITVFGCGGDRDKGKRPLMGAAAARHSDVLIVTSDNPRSEEPAAILADIEAGLEGVEYELIEKRAEAIQRAVELIEPGDVVLIAGKGHEDYQEIKGERFHFNDREEARKAISKRVVAEGKFDEVGPSSRGERGERGERRERGERGERGERRDSGERGERRERGNRGEGRERGGREDLE